MTIKEESYAVNRICPLLHVSAGNLSGCIVRQATLTSSEVLLNLFNMLALTGPINMHETYYLILNHTCSVFHLYSVLLVLTGPPKVEGVMFGNNVVTNGKIRQDIAWKVPVLRPNEFQQYIIRFADSLQPLLNKMTNRTESKDSSTTLQLDFHSSNITYYVRVAVKSRKGKGDFSDPVSITYTSEYTQFIGTWVQEYAMQHLCTKCYRKVAIVL